MIRPRGSSICQLSELVLHNNAQPTTFFGHNIQVEFQKRDVVFELTASEGCEYFFPKETNFFLTCQNAFSATLSKEGIEYNTENGSPELVHSSSSPGGRSFRILSKRPEQMKFSMTSNSGRQAILANKRCKGVSVTSMILYCVLAAEKIL